MLTNLLLLASLSLLLCAVGYADVAAAVVSLTAAATAVVASGKAAARAAEVYTLRVSM